MVCLAAECRRWQTGQARHAPIQKLRQVPLGSGRARPLDGDRHGQLADGGAVLGTQVAACPVDVGYQIELLGDPNQGADIPNCARTHRSRSSEIGDGRRCYRAKHNLTRNRATTDGVPHRLGRDTVAAAINLSFEYMHIFHVAYFRGESKLPPEARIFLVAPVVALFPRSRPGLPVVSRNKAIASAQESVWPSLRNLCFQYCMAACATGYRMSRQKSASLLTACIVFGVASG